MFGFAGKILHVDLTTGTLDIEEPPEERYRTYLGGSALGLYYLLKNTPAGADPYGPENTLAFMLSGTTGAPVAGPVSYTHLTLPTIVRECRSRGQATAPIHR